MPNSRDFTFIHSLIQSFNSFIRSSWIYIFFYYFIASKDTDQNDRFSLHKNLLVAFLMRTLTYVIDYYGGLTMSDSLQVRLFLSFDWLSDYHVTCK